MVDQRGNARLLQHGRTCLILAAALHLPCLRDRFRRSRLGTQHALRVRLLLRELALMLGDCLIGDAICKLLLSRLLSESARSLQTTLDRVGV